MKKALITIAALVLVIPGGLRPAFAQVPGDKPVSEGSNVTIEFTVSVPEEKIVIPNNISQYVQGQHQLLPALEQALTGMKPGEEKRVDLDVEQAFGPYDEKKKVTIRREELPPHLKVGAVSKTRDGIPFIVLDLSDTSAVVDFNHPLAGKHVVFDIKIVTVEPRS